MPGIVPPEVHEYVDGFLPEDDAVAQATTRGRDLGCAPVSRAVGATLSFLAASLRAKAVVEIGTGAGVSGLHLFAGMAADGVLTSIDVEPEHQRAARAAFTKAGITAGRMRLIMGRALDVLPRLTDGGYDLVFVHAAKAEYPRYHEQGVRLLRHGGVIAFDGVLGQSSAPPASPTASTVDRGPDAISLRELITAVREDRRLVPAMLPVGNGLLVAAKR
ncbi:MAG: O-methyltransferase [Sciscionella sp.]|nr:O-methyltransferase [Sciscionella sp.]